MMRLKKPDQNYKVEWYVVLGMVVLGISALFAALNVQADYVYEADQSIYDLQTNSSGSTGLGSNDDSVSPAFDLGFTFTFYGEDYTQSRMATNGCLHFILTGSYCNDYTPDPLPEIIYTLYPFWTDLIKDGGSAMRAKAFNDYTIFGWYNMREYNRSNSDNSFEVWLYPNNSYEFRYDELDIIQHDVLIGEQGTAAQLYTYYFFDECNTGTTNISGTCVSYDWNSSSNAVNTLLEDGGSLYGDGTDQSACVTSPLTSVNCSGYAAAYLIQQCDLNALYNEDCNGYAAAYLTQQCDLNALYDSECSGYAAAYLVQQCNITALYSQECPSYWSAYDDQQCENDPQYSPSCPGYTQTASVAYYEITEEVDYGYTTDYDDDPYAGMEFTDQEWYEIDIQEFGQELVDEWYGEDIAFSEDGYIEYDQYGTSEDEYWSNIDEGMDEYDAEQEAIWAAEELLWQEEQNRMYEEQFVTEEEHLIIEEPQWETEEVIWFEEPEETVLVSFTVEEEFEVIEIEEEYFEVVEESVEVLEIFDAEELVELYEFETIIREDIEREEERIVEAEIDEEIEELEEIIEVEEEIIAEAENKKETKKGSSARISALEVVANTIRIAAESVDETVESLVRTEDLKSVELIEDTEEVFTSNAGTISTNPIINSSDYSLSGSIGNTGIFGSTSGSSGGRTSTSGTLGMTTASSSNVGISTTSSPSISDQFVSSSVQTQEVLTMSISAMEIGSTTGVAGSETMSNSSSIGNTVTVSIVPMPTFDSTPQVAMADVQVQDMQGEINTAISGVMTISEADSIADKIVAQNIKQEQEEAENQQEETGEYGDESTLVAFLGYVPGFSAYREAELPPQIDWYKPRTIYEDAYISDNINAFYGLARTSINTMQSLINSQPNL